MPELVGYLLLFLLVGAGFILIHLLIGKVVRPAAPHAEKMTIYECGEPTIGSAWVQFDLRFYVVALLFVIFDVEVAFFFPWAVVFGQTNTLAQAALPETPEARLAYADTLAGLVPPYAMSDRQKEIVRLANEKKDLERGLLAGTAEGKTESDVAALDQSLAAGLKEEVPNVREAAPALALIAFLDLLVFFGVLLVGFAYLWKRGDLDWVRSTAAEEGAGPAAAGSSA